MLRSCARNFHALSSPLPIYHILLFDTKNDLYNVRSKTLISGRVGESRRLGRTQRHHVTCRASVRVRAGSAARNAALARDLRRKNPPRLSLSSRRKYLFTSRTNQTWDSSHLPIEGTGGTASVSQYRRRVW